MEYSFLAFLILSSLLLFTGAVDGRKDPAAEYWKDVMKDQPMPEVIRGFLRSNPEPLSKDKTDCHTPLETQKLDKFEWDLNLQSTAILYHGRDENKEDKTPIKDFELNTFDSSIKVSPEGKKSFVEDFEPRPKISVYDDGAEKN